MNCLSEGCECGDCHECGFIDEPPACPECDGVGILEVGVGFVSGGCDDVVCPHCEGEGTEPL